MAESVRGDCIVTHEQLVRKTEGGPLAVRVRSTIQAGRRAGEPPLYIVIEPENLRSTERVLYALDHPMLVAQVANANLQRDAHYELRANGNPDAPRIQFTPLANPLPFRNERANVPYLSVEDTLTVLLVHASQAIRRAEMITGRPISGEAQALASTVFIQESRDGGGYIQPSIARNILDSEGLEQ